MLGRLVRGAGFCRTWRLWRWRLRAGGCNGELMIAAARTKTLWRSTFGFKEMLDTRNERRFLGIFAIK
jgi:hypothetical protein